MTVLGVCLFLVIFYLVWKSMQWLDKKEIEPDTNDRKELPDFMMGQAWSKGAEGTGLCPDLSKLDPNTSITVNSTTGFCPQFDYVELEDRMDALALEEAVIPPFKIQTSDMLPETNAKGELLFFDGLVMRKQGLPNIWGDILCHPNNLELLIVSAKSGKDMG